MNLPLKISFHKMGPSPAVEAAIRKHAERLDRYFGRIMSCRVVVDAPHKRNRKGRLYSIHIDLIVPRGEIAITRNKPRTHAHEDVYVAIRDAFNAARRLLQDHVRKLRGDIKAHTPPLRGRVVRLFPYEGYGFIRTADGEEVYFHKNSVTGPGFDKLATGADVRLVVAEKESAQGSQASAVTVVGKRRGPGRPTPA